MPGTGGAGKVSGHEATEKANRIQAWQCLLDWQLADRFDRDSLIYSYWALGGVGSTSQSFRVQNGGKADTPSVVQTMCKVRDRQGRTSTKCNWVEVASAQRAKEGAERRIKTHSSH